MVNLINEKMNQIVILLSTLAYLLNILGASPELFKDPPNLPFGGDSNRYIVLVLTDLGLANRLRTLADWHQIAVLTKRKLLVSWKPAVDCNISFTELFEAGPADLSILPEWFEQNDGTVETIRRMAQHFGKSFVFLDSLKDERNDVILSLNTVVSEVEVVLTFYDGETVLYGVPCQYYIEKKSSFLSSLVPVKEARDLVEDVMNNYFSDRLMIGVHIRMHDRLFDWRVVPPMPDGEGSEGRKTALTFDEGATLEDFERVMEGIDRKFSVRERGDDRVIHRFHRFYVASNRDDVKQHFLRKYPDTVVVSGNYERQSPQGMYFALVEWLLLTRSVLIVNTYGSSYGVVAANVHKVPIVGIWGKVNIYHSSMFLPYCGIMQFIRAYGTQGYSEDYIETTRDMRIVNGRVVPLKSCPELSNWGLENVYCSATDEEATFL